ncbi:serine hydrolase domain-containing protein [Nonomuraea sp. NPDC059023]|uniref:serine hydrolase domain-containing protein n=1 Tax=unclassified Nonomuraea TaxID=2593643 RepID=UPI00369B79F4
MKHLKKALAAAASVLVVLAGATPATAGSGAPLDEAALRDSLTSIVRGPVPGVYSAVRAGDELWAGAAGKADTATGAPMRAGMYHRIGSVSKMFVATAILRLVDRGRIGLDRPVEEYAPGLLGGDRRITVRMLLNHTSHLPDHLNWLYAGAHVSVELLRLSALPKTQLVKGALLAERTGVPGQLPGVYSNTGYVVLGLLLEKVTGEPAERFITREVIRRAGLGQTFYPRGAELPRPHARAYSDLGGLLKTPGDFSTYDVSALSMAGDLVATMPDVNRFLAALLSGRLVSPASLAEMKKTVPVAAAPGLAGDPYGFGIAPLLDYGCGPTWGHVGMLWGATTWAVTTEDGSRQVTLGVNKSHPAGGAAETSAVARHIALALCGTVAAKPGTVRPPSHGLPLPAKR